MATLTLPLAGAVLCVNCETVSNSSGSCAVCGSEVLHPISRWIGTVGHPEKCAVVTECDVTVRVNCCYPQFAARPNRAIARELIAKHRAAPDAEKTRTV